MPDGIVAGVELDGLGGEAEGTGTALSREVEGAEVVHDLAEVVAVGDGDHGAGPIVLRHWYHVGHLRPTAGAGLSVLHRHQHLAPGGSNSRAGGEDEPTEEIDPNSAIFRMDLHFTPTRYRPVAGSGENAAAVGR